MNGLQKKRVIVVGGGYAGITAAVKLDPHVDVTLLEQKESFYNNVAALRSVIQPELLDQIMIPYDALLSRGTVVHDLLESIEGNQLNLQSGRTLGFDYLILATGSRYRFPAKNPYFQNQLTAAEMDRLHEKLDAADSVLIVGGGPVGVELAGEIIVAYPEKQVTMVHSHETLVGDQYDPKLREWILRDLRSLGVEVYLKARVKLESLENVLLEPQTYETELGQTFTADMAFLCVGARPNTEFLRKGFADHLDQRGYLRVNEFLQMEGNPRIFAAGDMIASEESKMIYLGQRQAKHAAENVLRMIRGEVLLTHQPLSKEMILVSMGEEKGASQLPIGNGLVFGSWVTGILKGKDLFIQRYQKMLGQKS